MNKIHHTMNKITAMRLAAPLAFLAFGAISLQANVVYFDDFSDSPPDVAMNGRTVDGFTWTANANLVSSGGILQQTGGTTVSAYFDFSTVTVNANDVISVSFDVSADNLNNEWVSVGFTDQTTGLVSPDPGINFFTRLNNAAQRSAIQVDGSTIGALFDEEYEPTDPGYGTVMDVEIEWDLGTDTVTYSSFGTQRATRSVRDGIEMDNFFLTLRGFDAGSPTFDNLEISVIPEPSAMGLVALTGIAAIWLRRRRS